MADAELSPYSSPVPPALYPLLSFLLLAAGLASTAAFFVYQATKTKYSRSMFQELALGGVSSLLLGWGLLFLLLSCGVYL
eukprot:jgi/Tetstr1/443347/TSEL_031362.t1